MNVVQEETVDDETVLSISTTTSGNDWILNSDCTFHMCPHKE